MRPHSPSSITIALALLLTASSARAQSAEEVRAAARRAAQAHNIPECYPVTVVDHESGGNFNVIGHDEDYTRGLHHTTARELFLTGGRKYGGQTFSPIRQAPGQSMADYYATRTFNNDGAAGGRNHIDPSRADLGIDWRFSHGFGLGQVTFPTRTRDGNYGPTHCPGRPATEYSTWVGPSHGGRCFTVQELLTLQGGVDAMTIKLAHAYESATAHCRSAGITDPQQIARWVFAYYGDPGNGGDINRTSLTPRVNQFMRCSGGHASSTTSGPTTPAHGPAAPTSTTSHGTPTAPTSHGSSPTTAHGPATTAHGPATTAHGPTAPHGSTTARGTGAAHPTASASGHAPARTTSNAAHGPARTTSNASRTTSNASRTTSNASRTTSNASRTTSNASRAPARTTSNTSRSPARTTSNTSRSPARTTSNASRGAPARTTSNASRAPARATSSASGKGGSPAQSSSGGSSK